MDIEWNKWSMANIMQGNYARALIKMSLMGIQGVPRHECSADGHVDLTWGHFKDDPMGTLCTFVK